MAAKNGNDAARRSPWIAAALEGGMGLVAVWGCQPIQLGTMFQINTQARLNHLHLVR
jgi:hypothetical protein